ncbi:uncharacterized protein, partial [Lepeophtheirus salmonis]|uniref:uncharacterized protein n=1 Tax=Lepeophtheirus salmonis TaxID=72036 RepID=UPI003AF38D5A
MKNLYFTIDDFELAKPLGKGKFGNVWLAREKNRGYIVALKIIKKLSVKDEPNTVKQIRREIEIHCKLNSKYIIRMFGYFYDKYNIYMVMEYASGGELFIKLKDIKPENLLIGFNGELKICDFGWGVCNIDGRRSTYCGTNEYLPPEIVNKKIYDKSADLWCLGILCYEFIIGDTPMKYNKFYKTNEFFKNLKLQFPDRISINARNFISSLLVVDSKQRITIDDVFNH